METKANSGAMFINDRKEKVRDYSKYLKKI